VRRVLERAYRAAGVAWIKPDEFGRRFFATRAVNELQADIFPVQAWLGHTDPKTTQRYARMRPVPNARILNPKAKVASGCLERKDSHVSSCFLSGNSGGGTNRIAHREG
jgi:integrase